MTSTDVKYLISRSFVKAVEELKRDGYIRSYRDFAISIGISSQNFNDIKSSRGRYVTIEIIHETCIKYPVNILYLFYQKSPILLAEGSELQMVTQEGNLKGNLIPSANSKSTLFEDIAQVMEDPARYSSLKEVVDQLVKDKKKLLYDIDVLKARNDALLDAFRAMSGAKDPGKDEGPENAKTQSA